MKPFETEILFTDHLYPCLLAFQPASVLPMKAVTLQISWQSSLENRVKMQLGQMLPHDFQVIEGEGAGATH